MDGGDRGYLMMLERCGRLGDIHEHVERILEIDRDYLHVRYEGERINIPELGTRIRALWGRPIDELRDDQVDMICALACFGMAWVRLEYVGMEATAARARAYVRSALETYATHLERRGEHLSLPSLEAPWWILAPIVRALRDRIDTYYHRLCAIDGASWFREELLLERAAIDATRLPEYGRERLQALFGDLVPPQDQAQSWIRALTCAILGRAGDPVSFVSAFLKIASEDPEIDADHTTLLAPLGSQLDRPWDMTRHDFLAYVIFREDFVPTAPAGDRSLIRRAMLSHHAAKKAKNARKYRAKYSQNAVAQLADNLGDLGIYYNEDAHHRGHQATGIVNALRFLMPIRVRRPEGVCIVEGLTDFRVTRSSHEPNRRFRASQVPAFYSYGSCIPAILEPIFERGLTLPAALWEDDEPSVDPVPHQRVIVE